MDTNHPRNKLVQDQRENHRGGNTLMNIITVFASLLPIMPFASTLFNSGASATAGPLMPPAPPVSAPLPSTVLSVVPSPFNFANKAFVLEREEIDAKVSGYIARVTVKQRFHNPNQFVTNAEYMFPLSDTSAVDAMTMHNGDRTVNGEIKRREEARQVYQAAMNAGYTASLLEQERTNVFTQSVANIQPGKNVDVTISYTETVPYANGKFSLVFPTKVGTRFMPAGLSAEAQRVASAPSSSNPLNLAVRVNIDEGTLPIVDLKSPMHQFNINRIDASHSNLAWQGTQNEGRDVIVNWQVASNELQSSYLTHKDAQREEGFITAMLMPPAKVAPSMVAPREMLFVIDCSGSQSGPPIEKAKETMHYILERLSPEDTFQVMAFNNFTRTLAPQPLPVTAQTKIAAHEFISGLQADGGTMMLPAVEAACNMPAQKNRLRIVTIMTDGFIGNDYEVIGTVKKLRGTSRWFAFGTGNGVNRTLIDGIAKEGGGEPEYVLLDSPRQQVAKSFFDRIATPVLTDVTLTAEGIDLADVYPNKVSDVWEQKPLYFQARYHKAGEGNLVLRGFYRGQPYTQKLHVVLPSKSDNNSGIAQMWARARIDELMSRDWLSNQFQDGYTNSDAAKGIVETSLAYHVMSQFTSFVAVDSVVANRNDQSKNDHDVKDDAQPKLSERALPQPDSSYQVMSPTNIVCALGAATVIGASRGVIRVPAGVVGPTLAVGGLAVGASAIVFGFARGSLQSTLSQSFSTTVSQLNCLNSYSASGSSGCAPLQLNAMTAYSPPSPAVGATLASPASPAPRSAAFQTHSSYSASVTNPSAMTFAPSTESPSLTPTQTISEMEAAEYDPYHIRLCANPFGGSITIDLQALALAVEWVFFVVALLVLTRKTSNSREVFRKLGFTGVLMFVSLNVQTTFLWLLQTAHSANLI